MGSHIKQGRILSVLCLPVKCNEDEGIISIPFKLQPLTETLFYLIFSAGFNADGNHAYSLC